LIIDVDGDASAWREVVTRAGAALVSADGTRLVLQLPASLDVPAIVSALVAAGARVARVEPRDASLEDAYLALVQADA
jgi:hypothetical protein